MLSPHLTASTASLVRRSLLGLGLVLALLSAAQADLPRAEHPRPDAVRQHWLNLNGEWQFETDDAGTGASRGLLSGHVLPLRIQVPFPMQSSLSGLADTGYHRQVWYRRSFSVPADMKGQRLLLHFGAVDYESRIYVNGRFAGSHVGGSASFTVELSALVRQGENELVVQVLDDLRNGVQPKGKQALVSEGCLYTGTTGIWQTVWLEGVGQSYVENLSLIPSANEGRVLLEATINRPEEGQTLVAEAYAEGRRVAVEQVRVEGRNARLVLTLSERRLWEPASPFLYDLKLRLLDRNGAVDSLDSYFGLRTVSIQGRRVLINGKPVFQRLILDQGFYPDGIWTAPSDAALRRDIELSMAAGFNGARLHQKVFEPRFLYWADKLGYLVWGEFPNWGMDYGTPSDAPYVNEWTEVLLRDRNHPSLVGWCPFNETGADQGRLQQVIWNLTRAVDPTRPVIETSGWTHTIENAQIRDSHDYDQNPVSFRQRWSDFFLTPQHSLSLPPRYGYGTLVARDIGVPFMLSEYGGIGWNPDGAGWGYGNGPKDIEAFYTRYKGLTDALLDNPNLFGFTYTQLTDVEQERNGLYYYDRRAKFDLKRLHAITSRQAAYERSEPMAPQPVIGLHDWRVVVGAGPDGASRAPWHYRFGATDSLPARTGKTPFGPLKRQASTEWQGKELLLSQDFVFDGQTYSKAALALLSQGAVEIRLNGTLLFSGNGEWDFRMLELGDNLREVLRPGTNTLEVRATRESDDALFDLALLVD